MSGDPQEREHIFLKRDGLFIAAWETQPYTEQVAAYPSNEFSTVLRGSVTVTPDGGEPQTFYVGDSFTIEAGWSGTWEVTEPFLNLLATLSTADR